MSKEKVNEVDKSELEKVGSMDITIKIRKPYLGTTDCPLPAFTTIDQVGNSYRISAPDIEAAIGIMGDMRDEGDKEPVNHRPAAMAAIKAELEAGVRKSEFGMGERWYAEIGDEVKNLLPIIMAAPDLLEAAKEAFRLICLMYGTEPSDEGFLLLKKAIAKAEGA